MSTRRNGSRLSKLLGKPGEAPAGCTFARLWLPESEAAARVNAAKRLGITYVEARWEGQRIMVRFAVPISLNFSAASLPKRSQ